MEDMKTLYLQNIPCGIWREGTKLVVVFESACEDCGIRWFDKKNGKIKESIAFLQEERRGNRYVKYLPYKKYADKAYIFYEGQNLVPDRNAKAFHLKAGHTYGSIHSKEDLKAYIPADTFEWGEDVKPKLAYQDMVVYLAHVRGFTAHASSQAEHPGTFAGMQEKIPYLQGLGINTLELQPVYEFTEYPLADEERLTDSGQNKGQKTQRLNYWGYKVGYYFAPKHAYSASEDAVSELKELIKAFHQNQMEVILQFYFPEEVMQGDICQILQYWVTEYHVDGFHLKGIHLPIGLIAENAALQDVKFWYERPEEALSPHKMGSGMNGVWARYNSDYMYCMRRFLKGDENSLRDALYHMRHVPAYFSKINYLSNYFGMTMMDMVSYNEKNNEANGEENRDGIWENHSWNCGQEGMAASAEVMSLRKKQIKNGFVLLMLSQGVPLIFMGDEFGNSQQGNNNPYCQDNDITWLNWEDLKHNEDLFLFTQRLITLRKHNRIFHMERELLDTDYANGGYPELSYHSEQTMQADFASYNRHIGVLYRVREEYGAEGMVHDHKCQGANEYAYYYLAINMYAKPRNLTLPTVPFGAHTSEESEMFGNDKWELLLKTGEAPGYDKAKKTCRIQAHSICLFGCKNNI